MNSEQLEKKLTLAWRNGNDRTASQLCTKILKKQPSNYNALTISGGLALKKQMYSHAIECYRKARALDLSNPVAGMNLAHAYTRAKQYKAAEKCYRELLKTDQEQKARLELGIIYTNMQDYDNAETELLVLSKSTPNNPRLLNSLAILYESRGDIDKAANTYRTWNKLDPENPHIPAWLAELYIKSSRPEEALSACEKSLEIVPAYTRGFALKYIAQSELGLFTEAEKICDNYGLIRSSMIDIPDNSMSVAEFNHELTRHILNERKKDSKSKNNSAERYSTINGWHSEFKGLFKKEKKLEKIALKFITDAISRYIDELEVTPDHPILTSRPSEYEILTWAVVNDNGGFQKSHIHPKSWLGGVYYLHLPSDFDEGDNENAGWIKFGEGEKGMHPLRPPVTRKIKPVEGMIVTFPGYFWHQTLPLKSTQPRICLAYDIQPTRGWGK